MAMTKLLQNYYRAKCNNNVTAFIRFSQKKCLSLHRKMIMADAKPIINYQLSIINYE